MYRHLTGFYLLQSLPRTLKMVHQPAYTKRAGRRLGGLLRMLASFVLLFIELWLFVALTHTQTTRNTNDNDDGDEPNLSSHPFWYVSFHCIWSVHFQFVGNIFQSFWLSVKFKKKIIQIRCLSWMAMAFSIVSYFFSFFFFMTCVVSARKRLSDRFNHS